MSDHQKLSDEGRAEIVSEYMSALLEITQAVDVPQIALAVANQAVLVTFDKRIDYHIVKNATQHHLLILDSLE